MLDPHLAWIREADVTRDCDLCSLNSVAAGNRAALTGINKGKIRQVIENALTGWNVNLDSRVARWNYDSRINLCHFVLSSA